MTPKPPSQKRALLVGIDYPRTSNLQQPSVTESTTTLTKYCSYDSTNIIVMTDDYPEEYSNSLTREALLQSLRDFISIPNLCTQRLIDTQSLQLEYFKEGDVVPRYGILSHRWIEGEEVSFREFRKPGEKAKSKSGYRKIWAACQQAKRDGVRYIWIDTCCIDNENSEDVARNIKSISRSPYFFHFAGHSAEEYSNSKTRRKEASSQFLGAAWTSIPNLRPQRLIDTQSLQLEYFKEGTVAPRYAILSHRWIEGEEVSFREFRKLGEETKSKSGYRKIWAACQRAKRDGFRYIWIDTCCIDNENSEDVARNIKSMYAYYRNASVCYAYLVDVHSWRPELFENSAWFSRGWTLQELVAPHEVKFFDRDWNYIGSKDAFKDVIEDVTGIPSKVLSGESSVQDVGILERMSWALGRTTTKLQDRAYCLQGLLGVSIEPDYNEDISSAFNRLRIGLEAHPEYKILSSDMHFCREIIYKYLSMSAEKGIRQLRKSWIGIQEIHDGLDFLRYIVQTEMEDSIKQDNTQSISGQQAKKGCFQDIQIDKEYIDDFKRDIDSLLTHCAIIAACYAHLVCKHLWRLELCESSEWFNDDWIVQELVKLFDRDWNHTESKDAFKEVKVVKPNEVKIQQIDKYCRERRRKGKRTKWMKWKRRKNKNIEKSSSGRSDHKASHGVRALYQFRYDLF